MRPANLGLKALAFVGIVEARVFLSVLIRNAFGHMSAEEQLYIPQSQWPKAVFWARVHVVLYGVTLLACAGLWLAGFGWASIIPLLLVGGPKIYGCWHFILTSLIQHGGLAEDVIDHRLNTRSPYMNPVSRWIYRNMN